MSDDMETPKASKVVGIRAGQLDLHRPDIKVTPEGMAYAQRIIERALTVEAHSTQKEDHNRAFIEDEALFRKRFRFAFGERGRTAVFALAEKLDLTDQEVTDLALAGCLHWDGKVLELKQPLTTRYGAWTFVALLGLLALLMAFLLITTQGGSMLGRAVLLMLFFLFFCASLYVHKKMIRPFAKAKSRSEASKRAIGR